MTGLRALRENRALSTDQDQIWKALADSTRREVLDRLREGPRTTTELVDRFPHLSRFAVMKHLDVLRQARLIHTRREGRRRYHSINPVPIRLIYERWVSKFEDLWAQQLLRLKETLEAGAPDGDRNRGDPTDRSDS